MDRSTSNVEFQAHKQIYNYKQFLSQYQVIQLLRGPVQSNICPDTASIPGKNQIYIGLRKSSA